MVGGSPHDLEKETTDAEQAMPAPMPSSRMPLVASDDLPRAVVADGG
jgi:hypothetical protein